LGTSIEEEICFRDGIYQFISDGSPVLGLAFCTVLPPDSIFAPVLPVMSGGKLIFGLCALCIKNRQGKLCEHSDEERAITDVWTFPEINYAVRRGYKVVKMREALVYDACEKIFESFYALLARMKMKSEFFAPDEDLQALCDDLNEKNPFLNLIPQMLEHNPALRAFAKLLQNSHLGKFSQEEQKVAVAYVTDWLSLKGYFDDPKIKVKSVDIIWSDRAQVTYVNERENMGYQKNTQLIVYAHCTAYSRIAMMQDAEDFEREGAEIYYTDTDSFFLTLPKNRVTSFCDRFSVGSPAYGYYKRETEGKVVSFASLGCKNYAYKTDAGESCVKIRGFQLQNEVASKMLSPETVKDMTQSLLRRERKKVRTEHFQIKADKKKGEVRNFYYDKFYANDTFNKRYLNEALDFGTSAPYGAKHYNWI